MRSGDDGSPQTCLAVYRFGGIASLLQLVNSLIWVGLGLFFVTGGLIGLVIERLLRGTTGRFRTLLLVATILGPPRSDWLEPRGGGCSAPQGS